MANARLLTEEDDDVSVKNAGAEDVEYVISEEPPEEPKPAPAADPRDDEDIDPENPDADPDETAAIRERRRKEKLERKERREHAMKRDKLELDFLRKRNDDLERRLSAQEQRATRQDSDLLDQRLQQAQQEIKLAEQVISKAIAAGNGEDVTQAMRIRDEAMARAAQISAYKQRQTAAPAETPAERGIAPDVRKLATEFIRENSWYDPQGRDEDSAIVLAIDSALAREGYDPATPDYWDELRDRAARRLPERFKAEQPARAPQREARGGPRVGSGKEHVPSSSRREVYISPERKQALIDAGVWDNPELRQKYIRRYAEYDRANRA